MSTPRPPVGRWIPTALVATTATTAGVLPVFLLGGLAPFIRAELAISETLLGTLVGVFFGAAALSSAPVGRLVEAVGARRALQLALALAATSLVGTALLARHWGHLVVAMVLAGAANGLTQPAANLALARGVHPTRQGLAFGCKQAAIPIATLLAGAAVPTLGVTVGWRWAFGGAALLLPLVAYAVASEVPSARPDRVTRPAPDAPAASTPRPSVAALLPVAIAGSLGAAGANAVGAFYVEATVAGGRSAALAGAMLSLGSAGGIATRLVVGWAADRTMGDPFRVVAAMMVLGGVGFAVLPHASASAGLVVATLLAFAAGWGWPGLFQLAVVREHATSPAAATGIAQTGMYAGGVVGPILFGWLAASFGYPTAWSTMAVAALTGATVLLLRSRRRRRQTSIASPRRRNARSA